MLPKRADGQLFGWSAGLAAFDGFGVEVACYMRFVVYTGRIFFAVLLLNASNIINNMAAGYVSIFFNAKGPNCCTTTACAASAHAIGYAAQAIRNGEADAMFAGGTEAPVIPLTFAGFNAMGALSTRNDEPSKASRPFDKERDGFIIGEGSGMLILEELIEPLQFLGPRSCMGMRLC